VARNGTRGGRGKKKKKGKTSSVNLWDLRKKKGGGGGRSSRVKIGEKEEKKVTYYLSSCGSRERGKRKECAFPEKRGGKKKKGRT